MNLIKYPDNDSLSFLFKNYMSNLILSAKNCINILNQLNSYKVNISFLNFLTDKHDISSYSEILINSPFLIEKSNISDSYYLFENFI